MSSARYDPPILRVMPEILTYIFPWICIANELFHCYDTLWVLSQVCQQWREIVLSRIQHTDTDDPNAHLWDALLDHCNRWGTIDIYLTEADLTCRPPKPQRHAPPLLERFHLSPSFHHSGISASLFEFNEGVLDALATAPCLHNIHVIGFQSPSSLNSPFVPTDRY